VLELTSVLESVVAVVYWQLSVISADAIISDTWTSELMLNFPMEEQVVCWASCMLSGPVLAWLSVWSAMQTCVWPSWCHCHSLSLASVKSRLVLPFWYRLTQVVPDKGPLNRCHVCCELFEHLANEELLCRQLRCLLVCCWRIKKLQSLLSQNQWASL